MGLELADESVGAPHENAASNQYSTFLISGRLYGISVIKVKEIVRPLALTPIPLAPKFAKGLANLRGRVVTAIGLRELLGFEAGKDHELLNVVCDQKGFLVSFLVDEIGDVIEVSQASFEPTPQTISENVRKFMKGVYKDSTSLLSILDLDKMLNYINPH